MTSSFQLLARLGATEGVGKGLDRVFAANFDQGVFAPNRFRLGGLRFSGAFGLGFGRGVGGGGLDLALVADLGPIAVLERTVFFDRLDGGAGVAKMPEFVVELFVRDLGRRLVDLDVLVAVDGEGGKDFEDGLGVQRADLRRGEVGDLRLADGPQCSAR